MSAAFEAEPAIRQALDLLPRPLVFVSLTGSRLYGLSSPRSDVDIRAVHLAPTRSFLGLSSPEATLSWSRSRDGLGLDVTSVELGRFIELLLVKKSGNALEALFSPLVCVGGPEHDRLRELVQAVLSRRHSHHYQGFSRRLWSEARSGEALRVKPALQAFRALLTGIHLMETGRVLCELEALLESIPIGELAPLIAAKRAGEPKSWEEPALTVALEQHFRSLSERLEKSRESSALPEDSGSRAGLEDFLIACRLRELYRDQAAD